MPHFKVGIHSRCGGQYLSRLMGEYIFGGRRYLMLALAVECVCTANPPHPLPQQMGVQLRSFRINVEPISAPHSTSSITLPVDFNWRQEQNVLYSCLIIRCTGNNIWYRLKISIRKCVFVSYQKSYIQQLFIHINSASCLSVVLLDVCALFTKDHVLRL